jgi:hypothetical protein
LAIEALRNRLLDRPLRLAIAGGSEERRETVIAGIGDVSNAVVQTWENARQDPRHPPQIIGWLGPDPSQTASVSYEQLPRASRLDVTQAEDPAEFLREVLAAAIG